MASGEESRCRVLEGVYTPAPPEGLDVPNALARACRILRHEGEILKAQMRGGAQTRAECRVYMALFTGSLSSAAVDAICARLGPGGDRAAACGLILEAQGFSESKRREEAQDCLRSMEYRYDRKPPCAPPGMGGIDRTECAWMDGYARAAVSRASADCGGAPACLALMGAGERACDAHLERVRAAYCPGEAGRARR